MSGWLRKVFPGVFEYDEWSELWKVIRLFLILIGIILIIGSFVL